MDYASGGERVEGQNSRVLLGLGTLENNFPRVFSEIVYAYTCNSGFPLLG